MAKCIVIVEDNQDIVDLLRTPLEFAGYEVLSAKDGIEGTNVIFTTNPDLVILDIMMPRMSGFQLCKALRESDSFKTTPVLFLTAKVRPQDRAWGEKLGCVDYITKPFEIRDVVRRIQEIMAETEEHQRPPTRLAKEDTQWVD